VTTLDNASINLTISATLNKALGVDLDLQSATAPMAVSKAVSLASGTGASQVDRIWADTRTIAASGTDDLDLAGVLVDAFGALITFARIRLMHIAAAAGNTNNVIVGGAAATQFFTWAGAATHTVTVRPGGWFTLFAPDATAYTVTAGTLDLLRVANSGAGTGVTYDIILLGASA
jgi:hypothetical protein